MPSSDRTVLVWAAGVLAVFVVAGGVLLGLSLVGGGGDTAATRPTPSASPSRLPSRAPSSTATASPSADAYPTVTGMKNFVVEYLDTATTSPDQGWQSLTPRFRRESGGFARYRAYWSDIASAEATGFAADTVAHTIGYTVTYTHRDGSVTTDGTRLHLLYVDGRYTIDGED